jgi:multicomponent Na+:H+ antiporter subunit G
VKDVIVAMLLLLGSLFVLLAALGVVRFPDLFMRMQAMTKASTLGAGSLLIAVAVHFARLDLTARSLLILAFIFITSPVAAHVIARAAYRAKVPLWEGSIADELRTARPEREPDG